MFLWKLSIIVRGICTSILKAFNRGYPPFPDNSQSNQDSQTKYHLLADNVKDVIWTADLGMNLTYISPSVMELRGFTPEEAIQIPLKKSLTAESYQTIMQKREEGMRAMRKGTPIAENQTMELEFIRKDGSTVWTEVIITPALNNQKRLVGVVGVTREITARKKAEHALHESEEKFRSFVENANEIVFALDTDGRFTYVSPKWNEMLEYSQFETLGSLFTDYIHADDRIQMSTLITRVLETGERLNETECRILNVKGVLQWHLISISPVSDNSGKTILIQGISHNITERKKIEHDLINAFRQLNLLSNITRHDILNQVNAGLIFLDDISIRWKDPVLSLQIEKVRTSIGTIQKQIEFTRVYQDLGIHEPRWYTLESIIPFSSLSDDISLTRVINGFSIYADPMIEKVFFNLLDNSIRHGQHVTRIRISAVPTDQELILVWEDNGVGIRSEDKEKIFDRGFGKNTGLGMFLVREILSLTGIAIRETGTTKGALFEIIIPKDGWRTE